MKLIGFAEISGAIVHVLLGNEDGRQVCQGLARSIPFCQLHRQQDRGGQAISLIMRVPYLARCASPQRRSQLGMRGGLYLRCDLARPAAPA
jgi:hypothetical protein